ncbi:MAG: arsenosugar biosynthesis radical SAM (seleno)protein ArsS [Tepidisphaeraceae bacterium]
MSSIPLQVVDDSPDLFAARLSADGQTLSRRSIRTLQLNLGKLCNLACHHCHVESGPNRTEIMTWDTMSRILAWVDAHAPELKIETVDLTGGAPEMNPDFKRLVVELRALGCHILDRCNLTILLAPGYDDLIGFLGEHQVEIVASLPCYLEENVDSQRGRGVYADSIEALLRLNRAGYGMPGSALKLDLVYNPTGYGLPPDQASLEADFKRELLARFGIEFHRLWTITNMPIKRFAHALRRDGKVESYMSKLIGAHRRENVYGVMCRDLISVGWQGTVYDCDFNQMLGLALDGPAVEEALVEPLSRKLWEFEPEELLGRGIHTGTHCFGCTAGAGSSCTGALS